jgi:hypothetical protein
MTCGVTGIRRGTVAKQNVRNYNIGWISIIFDGKRFPNTCYLQPFWEPYKTQIKLSPLEGLLLNNQI